MEKEKLNKKFVWIILILMIIFAVILSFKNSGDKKIENNTDNIKQNNLEILGNKEDLISFSVNPGENVSGVLAFVGSVQGGYFFEANILINILDMNKKVLKNSYAMATTDWMTAEPVSFEGNIDFTGLPKGPAYFEIKNDNPSDIRANDKSILIPVIIE